MLDEIQRFEYLVWFKGEQVPPKEIANAISTFLKTKDVQLIQSQFGTIDVPEEDVGNGPFGSYHSSEQSTKVKT